MFIGLAAPAGAGPQPRASVRLLPRRPFPLPGCVIDAIPGHPASEHVIGIYLSDECLARWGLHPQFALRRYISLKAKIERREPRSAVVDGQNRCHPIIWALRPRRAYVLGKTALVGSIEEYGRACGLLARGSHSCGRRRLRCTGRDSDKGNSE